MGVQGVYPQDLNYFVDTHKVMVVVKRKRGAKTYYYLSRQVRVGKSWKRFHEYLGLESPSEQAIIQASKSLEEKISNFYKNELVRPGTEFIDVKTAKKLETVRQEAWALIEGLNIKQKKDWLQRERERFITNTNSIEGNTLGLEQTKRILREGAHFGSERERLEVLNMRECLNRYDNHFKLGMELSEKTLLEWHYLLLKGIPDFDQYKGGYRKVGVGIFGTDIIFPQEDLVPGLMKELFKWHEEKKYKVHPVELAAKMHARFICIHPFRDGNGRIARMLMNYILQRNGFPFTNIPATKTDEYFGTQETARTKQDYKAFTDFLVNQIKENYKLARKELKKK